MFDFENLIVYKKAKHYYRKIQADILPIKEIDSVLRNQLQRSASSIILNIAEGCSRFSKADKRNFYIISRGSVFETVAILDILKEEKKICSEKFLELYPLAEELSRILFSLISHLHPKENQT